MTSSPDQPEKDDALLDAALRDLHRDVLTQPVPPSLMRTAKRLEGMHQNARNGRQWLATAAVVVMAFGTGWLSHDRLPAWRSGAATMARNTLEHEFVRQAGFAHTVYSPEKKHPVEVFASEQEHLVQWLSKRLGKPLRIPTLEAQGFELVGGRLLPGDSGARAQFMFQNGQGLRVTLYLGALEKASQTTDAMATQFRFEPDGPVPSFYWADRGFGYALSGPVDRSTLMALANSVYAQLN